MWTRLRIWLCGRDEPQRLGHDWSRWELGSSGIEDGVFRQRQRRQCHRCGLLQEVDVQYSAFFSLPPDCVPSSIPESVE